MLKGELCAAGKEPCTSPAALQSGRSTGYMLLAGPQSSSRQSIPSRPEPTLVVSIPFRTGCKQACRCWVTAESGPSPAAAGLKHISSPAQRQNDAALKLVSMVCGSGLCDSCTLDVSATAADGKDSAQLQHQLGVSDLCGAPSEWPDGQRMTQVQSLSQLLVCIRGCGPSCSRFWRGCL